MIHGGRASPLCPVEGLFKLTFEPCALTAAAGPTYGDALKVCVEPMICTGSPPSPRWRHTSAVVQHRGDEKRRVAFGFLLFKLLLRRTSHQRLKLLMTSAVVSPGRDFLFVFGGKNRSDSVLGDAFFLCLDQQNWTEVSGGHRHASMLTLCQSSF